MPTPICAGFRLTRRAAFLQTTPGVKHNHIPLDVREIVDEIGIEISAVWWIRNQRRDLLGCLELGIVAQVQDCFGHSLARVAETDCAHRARHVLET